MVDLFIVGSLKNQFQIPNFRFQTFSIQDPRKHLYSHTNVIANNYPSDLSPGLSPIALATVEAKGEALAKGEAISMAGIATSRSPSSTLLAMTTVP
jgi:hypothetical protein